MYARQVVVHEAFDTIRCLLGSSRVVYAHNGRNGVGRHFPALVLYFERRRYNELLCARSKMAPRGPLGVVGRRGRIEKSAGGVHDQVNPVFAPVYMSRIPGVAQKSRLYPVHHKTARLFVHIFNDSAGPGWTFTKLYSVFKDPH